MGDGSLPPDGGPDGFSRRQIVGQVPGGGGEPGLDAVYTRCT